MIPLIETIPYLSHARKIKTLRFIRLSFFDNYPCVALICSSLLISRPPSVGNFFCCCCKVFEIVKVGSSTLLTELSLRHGFYVVRVVGMANIHVTWLVYVRTYCVPIATLNQNKPSRLLYLGHAQITRIAEKRV